MLPEKFKILLLEGFFTRFDDIRRLNPDLSMVEIYNFVEDEYYELVGKNKFAGYNSFRNTRKHHQDKAKKQRENTSN